VLCDLYLADASCALDNYLAYQQLVPDDKQVAGWVANARSRAGETGEMMRLGATTCCLTLLLLPAVLPAAESARPTVPATLLASAKPDVKPVPAARAAVKPGAKGGAREGTKDAAKESGDVLMTGMSIVGNDEAPKELVIVPWKSSQLGDTPGISRLLDDSTQPVDKDVFMRELAYYRIRTAATAERRGQVISRCS